MATIFAPATAPGRAGIAVIRISGEHAADAFAYFGVSTIPAPRLATLVTLTNPQTGEIIDQPLALFFPAPHSFTGENTIELHVHGSAAILHELMECLGHIPHFRLAEPGEFSRQALYNNKMDLAEVEGLADLIEAETCAQKKQAFRQMEGQLSKLCKALREELIHARAHLEAYLDFPDEEIPDSALEKTHQTIHSIRETLQSMISSADYGEKIRKGFYITIIGAPNSGKSTLINALAGRDVAITSGIAGTTRDILEAQIEIGGYPVTFADTAGIRETEGLEDTIEAEGIRRAKERSKHSDLTLRLYDGGGLTIETLKEELKGSEETQDTVYSVNKSDLITQDIDSFCKENNILCLSAKEGKNIKALASLLKASIEDRGIQSSDGILTRTRHRQAFTAADEYLANSLEEDALELKAETLRLAGQEIGKVTGEIFLDDVLDALFSQFCIGK